MASLAERARAWVEEVHPHARHLTRTLDWVLELEPGASEALEVAAVTHDIERAFPDPDATWDSARDWAAPAYNRWHQDRCADMVAAWLTEQGAPAGVAARAEALVRIHEEGGDPEADVLQAADSLSFLETRRATDSGILITSPPVGSKTTYAFRNTALRSPKKPAGNVIRISSAQSKARTLKFETRVPVVFAVTARSVTCTNYGEEE